MTLKKQFSKIKENWLLLVLALVIIGMFFFLPGIQQVTKSSASFRNEMAYDSMALSSMGGVNYYPSSDFAPEVEERKIIKNANLDIELKLGKLKEADKSIKFIAKSYDAIILNENISSHKVNSKDVYYGSYTLKVDSEELDGVLDQLKGVGKVTNINIGETDVTGTYTNIEIELEVEKERLERYQNLYSEALEMKDKLDLNDRIFNQERTVKYLEDRLKNVDQRVSYSTIYLSVSEKSDYLGIAFIKLSEVAKSFVSSLNSLVKLIVVVFPWVIVGAFIFALTRTKSKKKTKRKR